MILSKFLIHTKINNNKDTTWGNHWPISEKMCGGHVVCSQLDIDCIKFSNLRIYICHPLFIYQVVVMLKGES